MDENRLLTMFEASTNRQRQSNSPQMAIKPSDISMHDRHVHMLVQFVRTTKPAVHAACDSRHLPVVCSDHAHTSEPYFARKLSPTVVARNLCTSKRDFRRVAGNRVQRVRSHYPEGQNGRRPLRSSQAEEPMGRPVRSHIRLTIKGIGSHLHTSMDNDMCNLSTVTGFPPSDTSARMGFRLQDSVSQGRKPPWLITSQI
ncbi:hypothetical protein M5K25_011670 [Dendrobium thyrsiflorum]|uniref:Uncharacterized protein n=1 Tax=Dendrobium thyrsiflorum TaxID=117978 RepID=A0ABD0V3D2_DENTH